MEEKNKKEDFFITITYNDTPCGVYNLENCPFGFDDCEECEEFLESEEF